MKEKSLKYFKGQGKIRKEKLNEHLVKRRFLKSLDDEISGCCLKESRGTRERIRLG